MIVERLQPVLLLLILPVASFAFQQNVHQHHQFQSCTSRSSIGGLHLLPLSSPSSLSRHHHHHRRRHSSSSTTSSALFSSTNNGKNGTGNGNGNGKRKKLSRLILKLNPIQIITKLFTTMNKTQINIRTKFKSLSSKGKIVFAMQMMSLLIMFGYGSNQFVSNVVKARSGAGAGVGGAGGAASSRILRQKPREVPYSVFMDMMEKNGKGHTPGENPAIKVDSLIIGKERISFRLGTDEAKHEIAKTNSKLVQKNDVSVQTIPPSKSLLYTNKVNAAPELVDFLRKNQIPFTAASKGRADFMAILARSSVLIIYMLFLLRMYKTMAGGGGGGARDTPGKLAKQQAGETRVKFEDIEGIDDAKFEVMELVDALRNPGKYAILGARAPRGLLLEGPPGTGKTMLARACAASAAVPLLYCSGSDFVEMFVGRGAARVRKTFERAGKIAPCIIFIDELDALGKSRSGGDLMGGMNMRSNDEAEQTLNQLLACMDGLDSKKGICVLAATNRREVLDQALIRPGRFDRIIRVKLPDVNGRERILRVHAQKLPGFKEGKGIDERRMGSLGKGDIVDLSAIAAITTGLSGAELEFIVNEAAVRAVRRVSSALREGTNPNDIKSPHVNAEDFETSVKSYFDNRKPGGKGMGDVLSSVFK